MTTDIPVLKPPFLFGLLGRGSRKSWGLISKTRQNVNPNVWPLKPLESPPPNMNDRFKGTLTVRKKPAGQAPTQAVAASTPAPAPSPPAAADRVPEPARVVAMRWIRTLPAFTRPRRPLAIGIHRQLVALRPPGMSTRALREALSRWTNHPAYLRALTAPGAMRVDLDGTPVSPVTPEQQQRAIAQLAQCKGRAHVRGAASVSDSCSTK
jgi:hypothetical protein